MQKPFVGINVTSVQQAEALRKEWRSRHRKLALIVPTCFDVLCNRPNPDYPVKQADIAQIMTVANSERTIGIVQYTPLHFKAPELTKLVAVCGNTVDAIMHDSWGLEKQPALCPFVGLAERTTSHDPTVHIMMRISVSPWTGVQATLAHIDRCMKGPSAGKFRSSIRAHECISSIVLDYDQPDGNGHIVKPHAHGLLDALARNFPRKSVVLKGGLKPRKTDVLKDLLTVHPHTSVIVSSIFTDEAPAFFREVLGHFPAIPSASVSEQISTVT